jgi:hypothetical protein
MEYLNEHFNIVQEPSKSGNRPGFQYILKFYKFQEWNEAFTLADKYPEYREQVWLNFIFRKPLQSGKQKGLMGGSKQCLPLK